MNLFVFVSPNQERSGSTVPPILNRMETFENPPTYNRTNKFTKAFQVLIDSYGVASYREMNPAPYTIITFPFLFAVMFGDLGHGALMTMFAAWMVLKEKPLAAKKSDNEIWNIFFGGRYIILLMGAFSMYTGLIYNDIFSKSLNIFGSNWKVTYNASTIMTNKDLTLDPREHFLNSSYPFGLDPIWQVARANKIIFQNGYKMKISIIFGVCQMLFGVVMSLRNYRYFNDKLSVITQFIPQIIFMTLMFGYLALLMFIKWIKYSQENELPWTSECAPSIMITFINVVLFKDIEYDENDPKACSPYMFIGQRYLQKLLILISLACVPWMLFAKPFHIMKARKAALANVSNANCVCSLHR